MKVLLHNGFRNVISTEATHVVVYDDSNNPIAATIKLADGIIETVRIKDKDFFKVLKTLGIDKTVTIDNLSS